jgi:hypothetical protein
MRVHLKIYIEGKVKKQNDPINNLTNHSVIRPLGT